MNCRKKNYNKDYVIMYWQYASTMIRTFESKPAENNIEENVIFSGENSISQHETSEIKSVKVWNLNEFFLLLVVLQNQEQSHFELLSKNILIQMPNTQTT